MRRCSARYGSRSFTSSNCGLSGNPSLATSGVDRGVVREAQRLAAMMPCHGHLALLPGHDDDELVALKTACGDAHLRGRCEDRGSAVQSRRVQARSRSSARVMVSSSAGKKQSGSAKHVCTPIS